MTAADSPPASPSDGCTPLDAWRGPEGGEVVVEMLTGRGMPTLRVVVWTARVPRPDAFCFRGERLTAFADAIADASAGRVGIRHGDVDTRGRVSIHVLPDARAVEVRGRAAGDRRTVAMFDGSDLDRLARAAAEAIAVGCAASRRECDRVALPVATMRRNGGTLELSVTENAGSTARLTIAFASDVTGRTLYTHFAEGDLADLQHAIDLCRARNANRRHGAVT